MAAAPRAHLRDVEQSRLLEADINECSKIRNVAHAAAQDAADGEVGELYDVLPCERRRQVFARVASRAREGF